MGHTTFAFRNFLKSMFFSGHCTLCRQPSLYEYEHNVNTQRVKTQSLSGPPCNCVYFESCCVCVKSRSRQAAGVVACRRRQTWQKNEAGRLTQATAATRPVACRSARSSSSSICLSHSLELEVGSGGQFSPSVWPHNPATRFRLPSATVVSAEPFSHGTGTLRCLQKEMATYRLWSVSLWRNPDDVSHCRILSSDKTEWRLISATLCGWRRCFVADQLWLMTRMREEEDGRWIGNRIQAFKWYHFLWPSVTSNPHLKVTVIFNVK